MQNIIIIGKQGQLAWELQRTMSTLGHVTALDRQQANLLDPQALIKTLRKLRPTLIINAAAYTAVDLAETEKEIAMKINGTAPGILAEEARRLKAAFIHYSTDYVFNGAASTPYIETDPSQPINVYGESKRAGEIAVEAAGDKYLIFRTSWVYGMRGKNFLLTMLKLAKERPSLKVVNDQIGAPTWSYHIAQATAQILAQSAARDFDWKEKSGLYHLTAAGSTSWHGFATEIFKQSPSLTPSPEVLGISSNEYPMAARRPASSRLNCDKAYNTFGIRIPSWEEGLRLCMSMGA